MGGGEGLGPRVEGLRAKGWLVLRAQGKEQFLMASTTVHRGSRILRRLEESMLMV